MTNLNIIKLANGWLVSNNLGANGGLYIKDLSEIQDAIARLEAEEIEQRKRWEEEKGMQLSAPQVARPF